MFTLFMFTRLHKYGIIIKKEIKMYKKIIEFIKNNMSSNTELVCFRVPKEMKHLIDKKSADRQISFPDYIRSMLAIDLFSEILDSNLRVIASEWITKQGQDSIEICFSEKINSLNSIIDKASFAVNETKNLQQKFIEAEVEYLDAINSSIDL